MPAGLGRRPSLQDRDARPDDALRRTDRPAADLHAGAREMTPCGAARRWRRRALVLLAVASVGGCLWRSYADVMRVHLDVLSSMADKVAGQAADGYRPTSSDVTELTYPLQRARQFAHQYRQYAERESYIRFITALDRYQALVEAIDAARGDEQRWAVEREVIPQRIASWRDAAHAVRAALAREG